MARAFVPPNWTVLSTGQRDESWNTPSRSSLAGSRASPNACSRINGWFASSFLRAPTRAAPRLPGSDVGPERRRGRHIARAGHWHDAIQKWITTTPAPTAMKALIQPLVTYGVRLDARFPLGYVATNANAECSELIRQLKERYTYHHISTHYVAVREQNTSDNPHYHIVILFDGSKVDNGWAVKMKAADIWQRIIGPGAGPCLGFYRKTGNATLIANFHCLHNFICLQCPRD